MKPSSASTSRTGAVIGVVAAVVIVGGFLGFRRFVKHEVARSEKTLEARNRLQELGTSAARAYERDKRVCPSASRLVPAVRKDAGVESLSTPQAWARDAEHHAGFACLAFSLPSHYYRYEYVATADTFTARAYGGDAEWGIFEIRGRVVAGRLALAGVHEIDPKTPEPPSQDE